MDWDPAALPSLELGLTCPFSSWGAPSRGNNELGAQSSEFCPWSWP